jgi:diguanylate cyclase (GGDEF)-like protein
MQRGWDVGSSHSDVLRNKLQSLVYVDADRVLSEVTDALENEVDTDISVELKDGRTIAVSYNHICGGGWVETHKDMTARRQAEVKIEYIAYHDALTDFPNRRAFNERLSRELRRVSNEGHIAVHLLDLNGFKKVNDQLGHAAGDDLLVQVAGRLRECVGEADFCARLGGDEFVIIQSDMPSRADAGRLAENVIRKVSKPYCHASGKLIIEISDGIAFAPEHGSEFDVLMRNADTALYQAKKETRSTFRFFDSSMYEQSLRRRRLEEKLHESLENDALNIRYQPIFEAATGALCGFEALCRWKDADEGDISPSEFIPIAEETDFITRLGRFVLNRACQAAAEWPSHVRIAVNVSPVQFRSDSLVNDIREALAKSGLAPSRLEIEVTETSLLSATKEIHNILQEIRSQGVRIVIDDFGTGCTGLSYLTSFRFDKLKIDRKFVQDLHERQDCRAIVSAIVNLCKEVGIATVGEGVETVEEFRSLLQIGCTEVQGHLFSPALQADQLQQFFDDDNDVGTAATDRAVA